LQATPKKAEKIYLLKLMGQNMRTHRIDNLTIIVKSTDVFNGNMGTANFKDIILNKQLLSQQDLDDLVSYYSVLEGRAFAFSQFQKEFEGENPDVVVKKLLPMTDEQH
jgi:hypothetical protein